MGIYNQYTKGSEDIGPEPSALNIIGKKLPNGTSELNTQHLPYNKNEIIMYQPDDSIEMEVLLEDETVWLSQAQMTELFQTTKQNVSLHINNVFADGELDRNSTVKEYLTVASNGKNYHIQYYSLDVIISVGYRVKSKRGTRFRQWANKVLKDHLLNGHFFNKRFENIEQRVGETEKKIDLFIRTSMPPVYGVFYEGQTFDAYLFVSDLVESAERSVVLLDNYVDETALFLLSKRSSGVAADIYTKRITPRLQFDLEKHNAQYEHVKIHESDKFHDRFLIIDGTVYHIGASLKDLGRKMFAFSKLEIKDAVIMEGL
ncbi:MAG: virulence RhuM family protein [Methanomassiliicoccaceae archaeon]|jgi:hypothetical protein|nr:virulence RhuM family protein [Methanomassiliicoccaceae archaeon]